MEKVFAVVQPEFAETVQEMGAEPVLQEGVRGTGDAVLRVREALRGRATLVVLNGDCPLFRAESVRDLLRVHTESLAFATLTAAHLPDMEGLGQVRFRGRRFLDLEEPPRGKGSGWINAGLYALEAPDVFRYLEEIPPRKNGELYLTDLFPLARDRGRRVSVFCLKHPEEGLGVNTPADFARALRILRDRFVVRLMRKGVIVEDPESVWLDEQVDGEPGARIRPFVVLEGEVYLGAGTVVGPFARIRGRTRLERNCVIGNFVEVKNSLLGSGVRAAHLAYLGDATVGEEANIGAGTITCNFDGLRKHRTEIGRRAFIGSDSILVAPLRIGEGAMTGAGSVITKDVPPGALALERSEQRVIPNYAARKFGSDRCPGRSQGSDRPE